MSTVGIYGVSGRSGKAYLGDLVSMGVRVYGYARPSENGRAVVHALRERGAIRIDRPPNDLEPTTRVVPMDADVVGHDLDRLVDDSDLILFTQPSIYHEETARELREALTRRRVPLVLSPSRTLASPYLWSVLGDGYPLVALQTCPYACKSFEPGATFIKRRKKNWVASLEGEVPEKAAAELKRIFPQIVYSRIPAVTSLGNIGAVFHPATYLLNLEAIRAADARGEMFPFYVAGIAENPEVGRVVEDIDQIRLRIAAAVGVPVFGLREDPREEEWREIIAELEAFDARGGDDPRERRWLRAAALQRISDVVVSAQHWLHYTYGVRRIHGEPLASAIGRTPSFRERSVPQARYADEDVPTGLVPFEALARRFGVACEAVSAIVDLYGRVAGRDPRASGRNLELFDTAYLRRYLVGALDARIEVPCLAAS